MDKYLITTITRKIYDNFSKFMLTTLFPGVWKGLRNQVRRLKIDNKSGRLRSLLPSSISFSRQHNDSAVMASSSEMAAQFAEARVVLVLGVYGYVPFDDVQALCDRFPKTVEDVRVTIQDLSVRLGTFNMMVVFSTKDEAELALQSELFENFNILGRKYEVILAPPVITTVKYIEEQTKSVIDNTGEKEGVRLSTALFPKPICQWCKCEQKPGDFSTPCLGPDCTDVKCHECLERSLEVALGDRNRMPLQCCYRAFHPDTLQGIVSKSNLDRYKERYRELSTKNPLYCPVLSCSTFIPPHKITAIDNKVSCPTCDEKICTQCRRSATEPHSCLSEEESGINETLQKFGYKRCPGCGAGNAKMYGCDHVKCFCRTDYCWKCGNVLDACSCGAAAENAARARTTDEQANGVVEITEDENLEENLDHETYRHWETESLDFGDEPEPDGVLPAWRCRHSILTFNKQRVPPFWMTTRDAEFWEPDNQQEWQVAVSCMVCWEPTNITTQDECERFRYKERKQDEASSPDPESRSLACICVFCGIVCCQGCADKIELEDEENDDL